MGTFLVMVLPAVVVVLLRVRLGVWSLVWSQVPWGSHLALHRGRVLWRRGLPVVRIFEHMRNQRREQPPQGGILMERCNPVSRSPLVRRRQLSTGRLSPAVRRALRGGGQALDDLREQHSGRL